MSLITSNTTCGSSTSPLMRYIFTLTDGTKLALVDTPSGSAVYYTSTDGGVTWSASAVLPGAGFSLSTGFYSDLSGSTLRIWYLSNVGISLYQAVWTGTALQFSASTLIWSGTATMATALWDGVTWHVLFVSNANVYMVASDGTKQLALTQSLYSGTTFSGLSLAYYNYSLYASFGSTSSGKTHLLPIIYQVGFYVYNLTTIENALDYSVPHITLFDQQGRLEFIYSLSNTLYYRMRWSPSSYGGTVYIDEQNVNDISFSATYDVPTNDLYIYYVTNANYPTGEIYQARRIAGTWLPVVRVIGNSSAGYSHPSTAPTTTSTGVTDLTYTVGTGNAGCSIEYGGIPTGTAPSKPINLNPDTTSIQMLSTLYWTYVNAAANDPQSYYQVQIFDSTSTLVWDSGQVASSAGVATPPSLPIGAYSWQVRTWDSFTNNGAGTVSPWSSLAHFTIIQPGALNIVSFSTTGTASTSSPATATSSVFDNVTFTWSSTNGYSGASYKLLLYDSTNTNLVDSTSFITKSINPGGTGTTVDTTHLRVTAGSTSVTGDGWVAKNGESIHIGSEVLSIVNVPQTTVSAQPDQYTLTVPSVDLTNFHAGDTVTIGPASATNQRLITYPAQVECATITSVTGTGLTFAVPLAITHTGHIVKSNLLTTSTQTANHSSDTYVGWVQSSVWSSAAQNSTTYLLNVQVLDTDSQLTTASPWRLSTSWTAGIGVSDVTWTTDPTDGSVALSWSNPSGTTSVTIQRSPTGLNTWTILSTGTLRTSIIDYPQLNVPYDYQIIAYNG